MSTAEVFNKRIRPSLYCRVVNKSQHFRNDSNVIPWSFSWIRKKITQTKRATITWHHVPVSNDDPEVKSLLNPRNSSGPVFYVFTTRGQWTTATGMALASPKVQIDLAVSMVFTAHFHGKECIDFCPAPKLTMHPKIPCDLRPPMVQSEQKTPWRSFSYVPIGWK